MKHSFFEIIRSAYGLGNLSGQLILRQAMMFENHLNCPDDVKNALITLPEWPNLDPTVPAPAWNASATPFSESVPTGNPWTPNANLHRVVKSEFVLKHVSLTRKSMAILGNPDCPAKERVDEFAVNVLPYLNLSRRKAWLFVHDDTVPVTPTQLMQDLGLYHYGPVDDKDSILRFTFRPAICRKPHWVDADLAFYFRQTDGNSGHGWTLSLRTGQPYYPELIHDDLYQLELMDVLLQKVDGPCDLATPLEEYWEIQRQRIMEART